MRRFRFLPIAAAALLMLGLSARPAHAESKDMIQLQAQVQQLQDALARLQETSDGNAAVLKSLVQQTTDAVNKMSLAVSSMQLKLQNQQDASGAKNDQLSGQVQALNDSLDELKARMGRMEKALTDIQGQQQTANAILSNLPQATPAGGANGGANGGGAAPANPSPGATSAPSQSPFSSQTASPVGSQPAPAAAGPSAGDLYRTAYGDYMTAKYPLAASEFNALIQAYPDDNLSGNAYFYLGEMNRRAQRLSAAVKAYDQVLERYPANAKIPAAELHKAEALIAMKQNDAGIRELHALVQRYPNSPEAVQARSRLSAMGASR